MRWFTAHPTIPASSKLLLRALVDRIHLSKNARVGSGIILTSNADLADTLGMTIRGTQMVMKKLRDYGLIRAEGNESGLRVELVDMRRRDWWFPASAFHGFFHDTGQVFTGSKWTASPSLEERVDWGRELKFLTLLQRLMPAERDSACRGAEWAGGLIRAAATLRGGVVVEDHDTLYIDETEQVRRVAALIEGPSEAVVLY